MLKNKSKLRKRIIKWFILSETHNNQMIKQIEDANRLLDGFPFGGVMICPSCRQCVTVDRTYNQIEWFRQIKSILMLKETTEP